MIGRVLSLFVAPLEKLFYINKSAFFTGYVKNIDIREAYFLFSNDQRHVKHLLMKLVKDIPNL